MYLDPADLQNDVNNFTAYAASYFKTHKTYAPLGHDPTFETTSRLWDYNLIAREGEYYNTTPVSQHCQPLKCLCPMPPVGNQCCRVELQANCNHID